MMIKNPHGWYECKRTHNWLKAKPFIEVTLRVVSIEEGTGRNEGRLGAIMVEGKDDQYNYRLNCGSGFSDSQREEYWSRKDKLIGQLVESELMQELNLKMLKHSVLGFQDSNALEVSNQVKKYNFKGISFLEVNI